jgi:hypothetical protein
MLYCLIMVMLNRKIGYICEDFGWVGGIVGLYVSSAAKWLIMFVGAKYGWDGEGGGSGTGNG